jgi:hypothetical protein
MKNWKRKVLYSLLFFLVAACAPQPGTVHNSTGLFGSGNQCKTMARKQLKLARNAGRSKKKTYQSFLATTFPKNRPQNPVLPYAPEKFVYFQASSPDSVSLPVTLASVSKGSFQEAVPPKSNGYLAAFQSKTLPETQLKKGAQRKVNTNAAKKGTSGKTVPVQKPEQVEKTGHTQTQDNNIALFFGLSGLLSAGLLGAALRQVRQISEWASQNLGKARGLLAFIRIFTALSSVAAGNYLAQQGIEISETSKDAAIAVLLAAAILYPLHHSRFRLFTGGYFRQKLHDIALFVSGTLMMVYAGNRYDLVAQPAAPEQTVFRFAAFNQPAPAFSLVRHTISPLTDNPTDQEPPAKRSVGAKIALTVLTAGVFFLLTVLLGALACNIACAGFGGLALLVFFAGEGGAVFLTVYLLKKIYGRKKRVETKET